MKIAPVFLALLIVVPAQAFQLPGFDRPASAVRDPETGAIFVSNIHGDPFDRDGNGYISRISPTGVAVIQKFIGGRAENAVLNAPKGLAIWAGKLLVADIDKVLVFDKKKGELLQIFDLAPLGARFLKDLALTPTGVLYVSDMMTDMIFTLNLPHNTAPLVYKKGPELGGPSGLAVNPRSNNLLIATWRTGALLELDRAGRVHILKRGLKNLDGVDFDDQWNLYVSSYAMGEVYRIPFLGRGTLSVFAADLKTPADVSFDRRKRELLVPTTQNGTVQSFPQLRPGTRSA